MDKSKKYLLTQVALHNTAEDCWIVLDGGVYDLTKYIATHPGGKTIILN